MTKGKSERFERALDAFQAVINAAPPKRGGVSREFEAATELVTNEVARALHEIDPADEKDRRSFLRCATTTRRRPRACSRGWANA